jgi:hypothetical protein
MAGGEDQVVIDFSTLQSQQTGYEFKDFHLSDPGTGSLGDFEGGNLSSEPQDSDKLLEEKSGSTSPEPSFLSFQYYQSFFDVTTSQVLCRVFAGMTPVRVSLTDALHPNPDLYGPFWLCATLIFSIAVSGNIARVFSEQSDWEFHFHDVTVLGTVLYSYTWLVPLTLWAGLWWRNRGDQYTLTQLLAIYGYSIAVFIPVVVIWVLDSVIVRWLALAVGLTLSVSVLVRALWKPLQSERVQVAVVILVLLGLVHAGLGVGFKYYYFSSGFVPSSTTASSSTK